MTLTGDTVITGVCDRQGGVIGEGEGHRGQREFIQGYMG